MMSEELVQPDPTPSASEPLTRGNQRGRLGAELGGLLAELFIYGFGALIFVAAVAGIVSLGFGSSLLGFFNILAAIVLIPTLAATLKSVRRRRASAVLGYLQQAVRLNLPIPRVLAAAACSETGRTRRRLGVLKANLESGLPLGRAIALAVPEVSDRDLGLIEYAAGAGLIGPTLDRLTSDDVGHARWQRNDQPFAAWYPLLMTAAWCAIVGLLGLFVAPKFVRIFHDFKMPLPGIFVFAESLFDWIWYLAGALLLVLLGALGLQLRKTIRITRQARALSRWRDELLWRLPIVHTLVRDRSTGDLCLALADSALLGYPLDLSLERSAHLSINGVTRRRTAVWAEGVRSGLSPADAARRARMPALLVGLMATVGQTGGLAEVLAFTGRFYHDRFLLRQEAVRAAVIPVFTLVMGVAVAAVALSVFVPMQDIVTRLAR
jgi:type II secretory pathway component PulF